MKLLYRLTPLLLAIALIGCAPTPVQTSPAKSGHAFAPAGAGFTVDMPGKIEEKHNRGDHRFSAVANGIAYFAAYKDFSKLKKLTAAQRSRLLDGIVRAEGRRAAGKGGKILSIKKVSIDGYEGRDLTIATDSGLFAYVRMALARTRLIQISGTTQTQRTEVPEITRFIDSFHITMH